MSIHRRKFLGGFVAAVGVGVVSPTITLAHANMPAIWGDLIHDDVPGLRALAQGNPVRILCPDVISVTRAPGGRRIIRVLGGRFLCLDDGNPVVAHFKPDDDVWICLNYFEFRSPSET